MPNPWTLAIDFGTTYTAAAATVRGSAEAIEIDGDRRVPSIIFVAEYSKLIAGKAAENQAAAYPERALRELKRMVGEPTPVVLAGRPFAVVDLVAALLQHVHERAVEFAGSPPAEVRLTHPATWRRPRVDALREAAARAGIGDVSFISEPVAAAIAYATEIGDLGHDGFVGVYDLGGGTFDTAVLRSTQEGFAVHGRPSGDGRIGGELFDELLAQQVGTQLEPAVWEELMSSDDAAWRQARVAFRNEVRKAKEALSLQDHASLVIPLPAGLQQLAVDRASYEAIITPYVAETIEQFIATVTDAGVEPSELRAVYLVGGASRTPMIERELSTALPDVAISKRGDPKMAVALGATMGSLPSAAAGSAPTEAVAASTAAVASTVVSRVGETEPSLVASGSGGSSIEDAPATGADPGEPGGRGGSRRRRAVLAALGASGLVAVAAAAFAFTGPLDSDRTAGREPTASAAASDHGRGSPTPSGRASPTDRRSSSPSPSPSSTPTATPSGSDDPEVAGGFVEPTPGERPPVLVTPVPTVAPTTAPTRPPTPAPTPTYTGVWSSAFGRWCTIVGSEGNDEGQGIQGTAGDDVICGLGGTDLIVGNGGNDLIDGGAGVDRVGYQGAPSGVTVNLGTGQVSGGAGNDWLAGIEGVMSSPHNDVLHGTNGNDYFWMFGGADQVYGYGGVDTADWFYLPNQCHDDTLNSIEEIYSCT